MAKYRAGGKGYESGKTITTKSWFGSHADMVVEPSSVSKEDEKEFAEWILSSAIEMAQVGAEERWADSERVVCKDDKGYYMTYKNRLDDGLADPNRYSSRH